jgi:hypothetical protein
MASEATCSSGPQRSSRAAAHRRMSGPSCWTRARGAWKRRRLVGPRSLAGDQQGFLVGAHRARLMR